MQDNNTNITTINYWYNGDIPRKTLLAWSLLLMKHNNDGNPLRQDLALYASVPENMFDTYIQEFCDEQIIDDVQSCRLQVKNGSFDRVLELVQNDIGLLDELPFSGFQFKPRNKRSMNTTWVQGGPQLLIETWKNINEIKHKIEDWKVRNNSQQGRTICFSTTPNTPELIVYFSPKIHVEDKSEFLSLIHAQSNILHEQVIGRRDSKGVIALAAAVSFGPGTFEGNTRLVMLGPITLMMIVHFFKKYPEQAEKLYNALLIYLNPFTGQRNGIIRGSALITQLQQVIGESE